METSTVHHGVARRWRRCGPAHGAVQLTVARHFIGVNSVARVCFRWYCLLVAVAVSVMGAVSLLLSQHSLRSGPSPRMQSGWQEMHCLRWCSQPWKHRPRQRPSSKQYLSSGFVLMDGGSLQGLGRCNNKLSDRMDRQSLLEPCSLSRTPLWLLLALHDLGNAHVIELGEVLHHG